MKKNLFAGFLALLLLLSMLPMNARAAESVETWIRDPMSILSEEDLEQLDYQAQINLDLYGFATYVLIVDDTEGEEPEAYARDYYEQENLGAEAPNGGALLLCMYWEDEAFLFLTGDYAETVYTPYGQALLTDQARSAFSEGDYTEGCRVFLAYSESYLRGAENGEPFGEGWEVPDTMPVSDRDGDPDRQAEEDIKVQDLAGLLPSYERLALEEEADRIGAEHDFGTYILVVDDMTDYGVWDAYDFATGYYREQSLGFGAERNGILLMLSMEDRDYAMVVYGDYGQYVFTDSAQDWMVEEFLDYFREDDWYGGFWSFLTSCDYDLNCAEEGTPVGWEGPYYPEDPYEWEAPIEHEIHKHGPNYGDMIAIAAGAGFLVALIACIIMYSQMKSVHLGVTAGGYEDPAGLNLRERKDTFTHRTVTRTRIQDNNNSHGGGFHGGGVHHSGGGFSGRSGKF